MILLRPPLPLPPPFLLCPHLPIPPPFLFQANCGGGGVGKVEEGLAWQ